MDNETIFDGVQLIEFLTDMSHKMRTPLNAIIGLTGLCLENDTIDAETYINLEKIYSAGITLVGNVDELLHVAGGQRVETFEPVPGSQTDNSHYIIPKRISLPYARVLVVDDNPTNLDVARGLLKPYRIKVDCVTGGQQAIDAIMSVEGKYDAILMDQMMPGIDGIEATKRIRDIGTDYSINIPVIAMTANAIAGSEEMFLKKGFQAYLSKPVEISRLDEVIKQWIYDEEKEKSYIAEIPQKHVVNEPKTAGFEATSPLHGKEIPDINMIKAINRFGGNEAAYLNVLRSYTVNTRNVLVTISKLTLTKDSIYDYEIAVHGIKGSSASIGADKLAEMAKKLENAAKNGDWDYISEHNHSFLEAVYKTTSDIDALFIKLELENPKPQKSKPDEEVLRKLGAACNAYDMDAIDDAFDELMEYSYEHEADLVSWLQENIDMMNFSAIVERLSNILHT